VGRDSRSGGHCEGKERRHRAKSKKGPGGDANFLAGEEGWGDLLLVGKQRLSRKQDSSGFVDMAAEATVHFGNRGGVESAQFGRRRSPFQFDPKPGE